jgi:hypothetical protein
MSHATVVVFAGSLEQAEHLLYPYSEQLEVDEHDRTCYCVGGKAKKEAESITDVVLGRTINQERDLFDEKHPKEEYKPDDNGDTMWKGMMARQDMWEKEYITPRRKLELAILDSLANKDAADPDCADCHGTGKVKTTYNPLAKHDYFTYEFSEPYGRGPWSWEVALKPEDVQENSNGKSIPFAIVTPMHGWQEGAQLGWWGMTSDKKEENVWHDLYFTAVNDALAMGLKVFRFDYHI